jgi:23S rRNA (guanosine2251-2'-O)-methyltransferase
MGSLHKSFLHPAPQVLKALMAKRRKPHRNERHHDGDQAKNLPTRGGNPLIYGLHACLAALANPEREVHRIIVATQSVDEIEIPVCDAANAAVDLGGPPRPSIEFRDRRELDALLPRDAVHQGVCIDATPLPPPEIEDIIEDARDLTSACVVVLDQATDPRNIGAVMRTAAAFGAMAVIVQDKNAPDITGTMAKAASGAVERLPLVRVTNLARTLDQLKAAEFWCVGFDGHATDFLSPKTLKGRNAIVLGAEGAGLRRLTRETCDLLVKIPMTDAVESLNLSNAAAIALYQFAQSNT